MTRARLPRRTVGNRGREPAALALLTGGACSPRWPGRA